MSFTCDDLRLGGTLSSTGIANGVSINNTAISIQDWSGVWGNPGVALTPFEVNGRPGAILSGDGLPRGRLLTLNMQITRWGPTAFALVEATEQEQQLANTDDFMSLLATPQYLEVDLPDTSTRFVYAAPIDPSPLNQTTTLRQISVPMFASPYWRAGGNESTDTISGADALITGGLVNVYDAVLVFAGDGAFTNTTAGWTLTIANSTGPVTVDLGARTVTMGGVPADQVLTPTSVKWGWFVPGSNTVTSSTSTVVTWRDSFL